VSQTFLIQNNDVAYDVGGQARLVSGKAKVRQDLAEMLSIEVQPDGQGAGIVSLAGSDEGLDDGVGSNLDFELRTRIEGGTRRLMASQRQSMANRTADEVLTRITNLEAAQSTADPRVYLWRLDVQTLSGQGATLRGRVRT
jgi:hypothetical protein